MKAQKAITPIKSALDTNALAFILAAGITDSTQKSAINTLVLGLKSDNLWTKMKAVYPFVGGTATSHKFNLMNPVDSDAAFRLVFNGGWTHSATGAKPNGTNGWANTYVNGSVVLSQNSTHLSYYSRTQSNGVEVEIGAGSTSNGSLIEIRTSGITYYRVNSAASYITYSDSDSRAFYIANRSASNIVNGWRNSTKVTTGTTASTTPYNDNIYLGAFNDTGITSFYSTKECAFASIGDGLTDTEASNLYTLVQAFQTSLSRQV